MGKFEDLTGKTFGELKVLGIYDRSKYGMIRYKCLCSCGKEIIVHSGNLRKGTSKSCGHNKKIEMIGKKFGKLTVIKEAGKSKAGEIMYICRCECGTEKVINGCNLRRGYITSCRGKGCYQNKKHGMRDTDIYKKYQDMKYRCNRKDNKIYGARGIKVCDEWQGENGFANFLEWSKNNGYIEGLSLDRMDVNGNYEPSNCRWVKWLIQAENKRVQHNSKTGVSGVITRGNSFSVDISVKGKRKHIGSFKTLEEAKEARKEAELKYWGWTKVK